MMMPMPQLARQREPPMLHHAPHQLMYNSVPASPASRQSHQLPAQLPAQRFSFQQDSVSARPLFRTHSSPFSPLVPVPTLNQHSQYQDNLLRRKTPSGTLPAAYDAAPPEWTTRPAKHILLPVEHANVGSIRDIQLEPSGMMMGGGGGGEWDRPTPSAVNIHMQGGNIGGGGASITPSTWTYTPVDSAVGFDLRHFMGQQQHVLHSPGDARFFNGQPYGFQSLNNPIAPPTASCEDLNGYSSFGSINYENTPRNTNWLGQYNGWDNGSQTPLQFPQSLLNSGFTPQIQQNNVVWPAPQFIGGDPNFETSNQHQTPVFNISQPPMPQESFYPAPQLENSGTGFSNLTPQDRNNAQFRDRVLLYAHKAYVELLASIQSQQREADSRAGNHQRSKLGQQTRTGLFPRPPPLHKNNQPPLSHHDTPPHVEYGHDGLDRRKRMRDTFSHNISYPDVGTSSSHSRAIVGADYGFLGSGHANTGSVHLRHGATGNKQPLDCFSLLQQVASGLSDEAIHTPVNARAPNNIVANLTANMTTSHLSVTTQAMTALDLLDGLCNDNSVPWTDGLLLGGCLAFGLGDLNRALIWYYRVFEADNDHVEAMSNLGATLLSLNRHKEAEQYWRRAVKKRPSYFEAVEYLIGLLCGEHRGREAVEVINFIEQSLRRPGYLSERNHNLCSSTSSEDSILSASSSSSRKFDYEVDVESYSHRLEPPGNSVTYGLSRFMIPGSDNGRMLALIHAKGNMLYTLGDNCGAAKAFEDAVLVATGIQKGGIRALINKVLIVLSAAVQNIGASELAGKVPQAPVLLTPDKAVQTARLVFPPHGQLPGIRDVPQGPPARAAISTTSNSLLSLAKIFQDGMSSGAGANGNGKSAAGVKEILALYYLSLSLHPSPSTANNVGILLASIPHVASISAVSVSSSVPRSMTGSGITLALSYYYYGLNLDSRHAHLYTNLGSLLKDINNLPAAIQMYEKAVACDDSFDIALANLANAVKDQGRINDAINYYRRAVKANPDFAEAVCGLANARNSVCDWKGRGGVVRDGGNRDRWHVDENGSLVDANGIGVNSSGWMRRVVEIVEKQLRDGEVWGKGVLKGDTLERFLMDIENADGCGWTEGRRQALRLVIQTWTRKPFEGAKIVRMVERASRRVVWRWYHDKYTQGREKPTTSYRRPTLPSTLTTPSAPTVLPFHTFTCPLSAKQVRMISERNGLRISCSTLRAPWLPAQVYPPPSPPAPYLRVGYVSSDFNNHPLAHLMQSVFGLHDQTRVKAYCYATTASDNSEHRKQIEREAPVFRDVHAWGPDRLVGQIVNDSIHILINLNGFTRGARNEIFAARPAPIQMSFMGFAGTLGAEWCDYLYADSTAVPQNTLRPWRRNVDIEDEIHEVAPESDDKWVYAENIIFARYTFFCCDHKQSAPDSKLQKLSWDEETRRRWAMRKTIFPELPHDTIILANFNQLYKIEPTTFRTWLRILQAVPKAILWLLRFPDLGENNLLNLAEEWAGSEVRSRIRFTDVAPKAQHIARAQVCDIFLDTPECNAHTTAADVLWSGTPLLTFPRHQYKMCSRIAASILRAATPQTPEGKAMANSLVADSEQTYEERAIELASNMIYDNDEGRGAGELFNIRKTLFENRWKSELFNTKRWVRDLEDAYEEAWQRWVDGDGGDIYLNKIEKSY